MVTKEKSPIQWMPAPGGVIEIYANMATIQWSLDDVRVRLAQMINSPDTPNPGGDLIAIAQEKAAITVTWRGAKIMLNNLSDAIAAYERANGEIITDLKLPNPGQ
ncbi:MAG: DUF3467 domain-containing protein [Acidobacteriota bacterium]